MKHSGVNVEGRQRQDAACGLTIEAGSDHLPYDSWSDVLDFELTIYTDPSDIEDDWVEFENRLKAGHSNSNWALAWYEGHKSNDDVSAYVIVGRRTKRETCFILALERAQKGPITILQSPGAGHATYTDGLFDRDILALFESGRGDQFWNTVFAALENVDTIALEGFAPQLQGAHHPFASLPLTEAAHDSMQMEIQTDWPTQYKSIFDGKTRSNDRRVERRLKEFGELTHMVATHTSDRLNLLDVMLEQKAEQFEQLKINDPYGSPEVVGFYKSLIEKDAKHKTSSLYISAMLLNDRPLAVNFGIRQADELQGLITSMTTGEHKRLSPGRLLMINTNKFLSETNVKFHDFGMGEFSYKQEWCDRNVGRTHVLKALTLQGQAYVMAQKAKQSVKSSLNNHLIIKRMLKRLHHHASQSK